MNSHAAEAIDPDMHTDMNINVRSNICEFFTLYVSSSASEGSPASADDPAGEDPFERVLREAAINEPRE